MMHLPELSLQFVYARLACSGSRAPSNCFQIPVITLCAEKPAQRLLLPHLRARSRIWLSKAAGRPSQPSMESVA